MCGIVGIYNLDHRPVDANLLQRMTDTLAHRGPNGEGHHIDGGVGLGFRRLAIIDLSSRADQPMRNEDGTVWIVFNGEIYNYRQLRPPLEAKGHTFLSQSDTEVIIHAYEEYGLDCLNLFNGMWAFAIWDQRKQQLFCARDRFGVKPFYYGHNGRRFVFASEIKALFCDPDVPRRPNNRRIYEYLVLNYLNHTDETLFEGIAQLPAASYMLLDETHGLCILRYWDLKPSAEHRQRRDEEWIAEFCDTLTDAVRLHLRSDVPIGSCLSGGIDSSSIVCIANQLLTSEASVALDTRMGDHQKTFSSVFDCPGIDEKPFIEAVLKQTGVEGHAVTPPGEELVHTAPRLIWHQGEPFGSTTIYAQWHVMQLARSAGITVLLDGQGADELLAGYSTYYSSFWAELIRTGRLVTLWREWRSFPYHLEINPFRSLAAALRRLALHATKRDRLRSSVIMPAWLGPQLTAHYMNEQAHGNASPGRSHHYTSVLDEHLYDSLTRSSLPSLLHYEDHNSMAFSIEARVPYLDYRLVELCYSLPIHLKINKGTTKVILREAMRNVIPEIVRSRQDKLGFPTPGDIWFREYIGDEVEQVFHSPSFREHGYVKPEAALALLDRYRKGEAGEIDKLLWRMVCLELWAQLFFDRSNPTIRP